MKIINYLQGKNKRRDDDLSFLVHLSLSVPKIISVLGLFY